MRSALLTTFHEACTSCQFVVVLCLHARTKHCENKLMCTDTDLNNAHKYNSRMKCSNIKWHWPTASQLTYFSKPDKTLLSKRLRQACVHEINGLPSFKRTNHHRLFL